MNSIIPSDVWGYMASSFFTLQDLGRFCQVCKDSKELGNSPEVRQAIWNNNREEFFSQYTLIGANPSSPHFTHSFPLNHYCVGETAHFSLHLTPDDTLFAIFRSCVTDELCALGNCKGKMWQLTPPTRCDLPRTQEGVTIEGLSPTVEIMPGIVMIYLRGMPPEIEFPVTFFDHSRNAILLPDMNTITDKKALIVSYEIPIDSATYKTITLAFERSVKPGSRPLERLPSSMERWF